jgi:AcrR family transcriptional regulator
MLDDGGRPSGLRERKKARTRAAIREHALRLFSEQGYDATTVEQIAEAAEVSPSTFFRYFPTKEDVVLQDDFDLLAMERFLAQPPELGPIAAYRAAAAEMFAELTPDDKERLQVSMELTFSVPEIRARALDEFLKSVAMTAEALARRTGRPPADPALRNLAGATTGVIMAAALEWNPAPGADPVAEMAQRIDASLAHLEAGLPL